MPTRHFIPEMGSRVTRRGIVKLLRRPTSRLWLKNYVSGDVLLRINPQANHTNSLMRTPALISIMDDHEIFNDFSANTSSPMFAPATAAFRSYLGAGNPTISSSLLSGISDLATEPINYFDYQYGDAAFFFLDTRAYRSPNSMPDEDGKTMLGEKQKQAFFEWVDKVSQRSSFFPFLLFPKPDCFDLIGQFHCHI